MSDSTNPANAPSLEPSSGVETDQPTKLERRNSLEKQLAQRPNEQELKDKHILLDTKTAPALQSTQHDLERQRATDSLKKGLAQRPERGELVGRNILPESTAAPALQAHQRDLERHMRKDSLEKHLQNRPKPGELVKEGILDKNEAPVIEE